MKADDFLSMIASEEVVDLKTTVENTLKNGKLTAKVLASKIGITTESGINELYSILAELRVEGKLAFEGLYYYLVR